MKNCVLLCVLSLITINVFSQAANQKVIGQNIYSKQGNIWQVTTSYIKKSYEVNQKVITIKSENKQSIPSKLILRKNKLGFVDVKVPDNTDLMNFYETLQKEYGVKQSSIEINYYADLLYIPNDFSRINQWYIDKIKADKAWGISLGKSSVIVAVIDYGFYWQHKDIGRGKDHYENVWVNTKDIWANVDLPLSGDKIDNDKNGFIDDFKG